VQTIQQRLEQGLTDRYRVERELGQGGMAVVFLARDLRHDRNVAIKVLRPDVAGEIGADRFLREIRLAAGLTHPHILPVHDSGEAGGLLFYVMPNMEGQSLRDRLVREKMLSLEDALRITREIASALDYAHRRGVVHRDIKPENILLHEGSALVADFGIGKAATAAGGSLTQTGLALGTPAYMSPEQATAETEVDGRSDLYSLGCVLYEMLTGEQPYTGATAQAVITKRFISPVPHVRAVRDVPEPLDAAVIRALARTPVDRFPTIGEFADALLQIQRDGSTPGGGVRVREVAAEKSIAVLPFSNMSADPENEYFSDGMTEEILNALAAVPDVQVASRTSCFAFKGKEIDIRKIGEQLGVTSVLEGSVRKIGNRIRISVQLSNVANGYRLWSQVYDRQLEDVFAIQEEIARAIADALQVRLGGAADHLVKPTTENLEAYTLYLKGRFLGSIDKSGDTLRKALSLFEQALDIDPGYARAYSGIADCWAGLADNWLEPGDAYPRAKSAATRAIQLEPTLAEAYTSLGKVLAWYEWKFDRASEALAKAVQYNPSYAEAHFVLGSVLPSIGRLPEAIEEMQKALVLDPLSAPFSRWIGRFLVFAGRYEEAIAQCRKTLEIDANAFLAHLDAGSAMMALGRHADALQEFRRGQLLGTAARSYDAMIVRGLAALGEVEEARAIMDRLGELAKHQYLRGEVLAAGHAALGAFDRAFDCLDRARGDRSAGLVYLHLDPAYQPLRGDPRYLDLIQHIGVR
jgi:serine/threonine-protein kinase